MQTFEKTLPVAATAIVAANAVAMISSDVEMLNTCVIPMIKDVVNTMGTNHIASRSMMRRSSGSLSQPSGGGVMLQTHP